MAFRLVSPSTYGLKGADFYLLETEVTNAVYATFLSEAGRSKGDEEVAALLESGRSSPRSTVDPIFTARNRELLWKENRPPEGKESFPVALLTVGDAAAFCEWLTKRHPSLGTFRFPTVDEWEVAAYGGGRAYPWGNEWNPEALCASRNKKDQRAAPRPVGSHPKGATPEGILDLWGNVDEYVIHPENLHDVVFMGVGARWMGGSFEDHEFKPRQDYWGYAHSSEGRRETWGFRVLLDPTDKEHRFKHQTPYDRERRR